MLRTGIVLALYGSGLAFYSYGYLWGGVACFLAGFAVLVPALTDRRRRVFYAQRTSRRGLKRLAELEATSKGTEVTE